MPPKKVVEVAPPPPIEGAKFAYVTCGDFRIMVNCNCRLDIILDYVRLEIIKMVNAKIEEIRNDPINLTEPNFQENVDKFLALLSKLTAVTNIEELDLFVDGANINCKQVYFISPIASDLLAFNCSAQLPHPTEHDISGIGNAQADVDI